MSHIDTLKEYKALLEFGFSPSQSEVMVEQLNTNFETMHTHFETKHKSFFDEIKEWFKEAKEDFASQKLIAILGGLILLTMTTGVGLMWHISVELSVLKTFGIERK